MDKITCKNIGCNNQIQDGFDGYCKYEEIAISEDGKCECYTPLR